MKSGRLNNCCKGCQSRSVNCHATCKKYAEYRNLINNISAARQKETVKDTLILQRFVKSRDVLLDKKKHGRKWTLV